jgi:hypothetical protein
MTSHFIRSKTGLDGILEISLPNKIALAMENRTLNGAACQIYIIGKWSDLLPGKMQFDRFRHLAGILRDSHRAEHRGKGLGTK